MRSTTTESVCRAELERHIEEMIALLDLMDGDADFEDGGDDEPSFMSARFTNGRLEYDLEADPAESGIADIDALELIISSTMGETPRPPLADDFRGRAGR